MGFVEQSCQTPEDNMADAEFNWSELPVDPQDPQSAGKKLLGYIESQLRSGMTEDAIRDAVWSPRSCRRNTSPS